MIWRRGANGLMIEVHESPEDALCDGPQSLAPADFTKLMKKVTPLASNFGKEMKHS